MIMGLNKEMLLKTADWIENEKRFDLSDWIRVNKGRLKGAAVFAERPYWWDDPWVTPAQAHDYAVNGKCGTTCCIAGAAIVVGGEKADWGDPEGAGVRILGLTDDQAEQLFMPASGLWNEVSDEWDFMPTAEQAAAMLRNIAKYGWKKGVERGAAAARRIGDRELVAA